MVYKEDTKKWRKVVVTQQNIIVGLVWSVMLLLGVSVGLFWLLVR